MGPCVASVESDGALIARISGGGETLSVIPISNATNLNGVGAMNLGYWKVSTQNTTSIGTTTTINATGIESTARVGDIAIFRSGSNVNVWSVVTAVNTNSLTVGNAYPVATTSGASFSLLRPIPLGSTTSPANVDGMGSLLVNLDYNYQGATATGILKLVDTAWGGAADAGVQALAVMNTDESSLVITEGDYMPFAVASNGVVKVSVTNSGQKDGASGLIKQEDVAAASGDAGVAILNQRLDQLATGQTGSNNEYALPIVDTLSRLYVNPWGSAVTEFSSSCGTATASTADVAIKAAVASNRIYVGAITCASSDADNATNINFKDGTTVVAVGGVNQMATTSAGTFTATFNPPLRGTSNTAFNFNTAVSTSSVICCASTFTSPY